MRKRLMIVTSVIALCACAFVGTASANSNDRSDIYKLFSSSIRTGVRSGITDPSSSQKDVVSGDAALSSVWATNGKTGTGEEGLQQGVIDTTNYDFNGEPGTCSSYASNYFYFDEKDSIGNYTCDYEGLVGSDAGSSQRQAVNEDSSGDWWGYINGTKMDPSMYKTWPAACGGTGNACGVYAFVEDLTQGGSCWDGKFSGSGNYPWATQYDGSWHNAFPDNGELGTYWTTNLNTSDWTFPNSNDPNSSWYFKYNNGNSCS